MTGQACAKESMMLEKFYLHRREGSLRTFLLLPMHCYSTLGEWLANPGIVGGNQFGF